MAELQQQIELTTPVEGKKVVIRGFVNGRIKQAISAMYLAGSTIETTLDKAGKEVSKQVTNALVGQDATLKALELMVISVEGQAEGVVDSILDLCEQDYDFVKAEVDKVRTPLAKTTDSGSKPPTTTQ